MPKISIRDTTFYYEIHGGNGYPVILIAGYSVDHTFWYPILESLSKKFKVLIFDNRGVGQTDDSGLGLSASLMAEDVMALAGILGLSRPHIIGHSMGGIIAQCIARDFGDKIHKIALLNSAIKLRLAALQALHSLLLLRKCEIEFDLQFQTGLPWFYGDRFLQDKQALDNLKESILNNPHPQRFDDQQRQYEFLLNFQGLGSLEKIKSPCLVTYGKADLISLPSEVEYLASQIPYSSMVGYDSGHVAISEIPNEVSQLLISFLS